MQQPPSMYAYRQSHSRRGDVFLDDDEDTVEDGTKHQQLETMTNSQSSSATAHMTASIVTASANQDQPSSSSTSSSRDGLHRRKPQSHPPPQTEAARTGPADISSSGNNKQGRTLKTALKHMLDGWMQSHWPILLVSILIFIILAGSGIALFLVIASGQEEELRDDILDLAAETGAWFANELDFAILPLFSMAQFATELELFAKLPDQIKSPGEPNALPFVPIPPNSTNYKVLRNVTGVCDQPDLIERFTQIASAIKTNANMDGVLHNIQLAPQGVICLLHPMNNTEDFEDGKSFLDNTGAWGVDLLHDPFHRYIARQSLKTEEVGIAGPRALVQCPTCGMYFIARLPVISRTHTIEIDGEFYPRWGFTTALINWDALVQRSGVHERFHSSGLEFQLTRTDHNYDDETDSYYQDVVVLAQSDNFGTKAKQVSTALQTTNNEWVITIEYNPNNDLEYMIVIFVSFIVAFFIAALVYTVLVQKQTHTAMLGTTMAEKAKVELERHLTAALAHELRNPLGAIDSALATMPDDLPAEAKELVASMQLCSSFMSSIMNNLLDSRKLEEGKMALLCNPMSLKQLIQGVHKMMLPAVNQNVQLIADTKSIPPDKEWVFGDYSRLQQVLTNLVSNACKFTRSGSITISAQWVSVPSTTTTTTTTLKKKKKRDHFHNNNKKGAAVVPTEEWVQLLCRDTGPGIPKEDQANMFNRFTTRGGAPGSGLGLSIAKQIVDLGGGSIRFESDPTVKPGTDCIVLLPMKVCHDDAVALTHTQLQPKPEETTATNSNKGTGTVQDTTPIQEPLQILLTDDIKMNRVMLKRRFQKCVAPNCTIVEAATGEEALKICETQQFDVILMDQYMQEASGVMVGTDVIIALRRNKVDAVMIGCSGNDLEDKFESAGADMVWKKPIPTNVEIITSLRRLLAERGKV